MKATGHEATELVPPRKSGARVGSRIEVSPGPANQRPGALRSAGAGSPQARDSGTRRTHAVREEVRDVWLTRWLRDFAYDLRYSARSFLRSPSFTVTAVLSLALGIGAATAIYSLFDQVLLHALPVRQPERLVLIDWKGDQAASGFGSYNLM